MTKILFHYDATAWCSVRSVGRTLQICHFTTSEIEPQKERNVIGFDVYQAALLAAELDRFIEQRSAHLVGDLSWRVTDGVLFLNDVQSLELSSGFTTHKSEAFSLVSKLLTRGVSCCVFDGLTNVYRTDLQIESWILERIETLNAEAEF